MLLVRSAWTDEVAGGGEQLMAGVDDRVNVPRCCATAEVYVQERCTNRM